MFRRFLLCTIAQNLLQLLGAPLRMLYPIGPVHFHNAILLCSADTEMRLDYSSVFHEVVDSSPSEYFLHPQASSISLPTPQLRQLGSSSVIALFNFQLCYRPSPFARLGTSHVVIAEPSSMSCAEVRSQSMQRQPSSR